MAGGNGWKGPLLFTDLNATDIIFTDIIIYANVFSVKVMSVIIVFDKVCNVRSSHRIMGRII